MRHWMQRIFALFLAVLLCIVPAFAADDDASRLYTFSPGNVISSSEMNSEFNNIITILNGKMSRAGTNTISGTNTFSGNNTHSGQNTFSHATNPISVDKISERTAANGVAIDGVILKDFGITFTDAGELTIATGAVTATGSFHTLDTESDAASDDLDTINGGAAGRELFIQAENDARTVVVKHNTGNIFNPTATDISLDDDEDIVHLVYSAALSKWVVINAPGGSASDTAAGAIEIAVQSEMETATDTTRAVVPGRQQYHPSASKAWVYWNMAGTQAIKASYNITSITDAGVGRTTVTIANDFSSVNYATAISIEEESAGAGIRGGVIRNGTQAAGSIEINCFSGAGALADLANVSAVMFGDQ